MATEAAVESTRKTVENGMPRTIAGQRTDKRPPLSLRTTRELRDMLEAAALASGRSLAQEVEDRLEGTFEYARRQRERQLAEVFANSEVFGLVELMARALNEAGRTAGFVATRT